MSMVDAVRREFHDARHHCWAFRLAPELARERSSDDGEPSGSAGKPILAQLEGAALYATAVVVVRWFGGTKLGVGGLVRAYGEAAHTVLEAASREHVVRTKRVVFEHPYEASSAVEKFLAEQGIRPAEQAFSTNVHLEFDIRIDRASAFTRDLVDRTSGRGQVLEP
ncbi:MAG: YigZ family protein [Planctomycetes bacterium]|nr:YigZ family protein [Planctomycetota bacterium]MCB9918535.1 YigZ family protein [Planctomycetota bacterium]